MELERTDNKKQVLLKLSGESLATSKLNFEKIEKRIERANKAKSIWSLEEYEEEMLSIKQDYLEYGINFQTALDIANSIISVNNNAQSSVKITGIVVGGGNFWRGQNHPDMHRNRADKIGMLATTMNGLALENALLAKNAQVRLMTGTEMRAISELFIDNRAIRHIEKDRIVIFAGGTGQTHFTTDTGGALRAAQIGADAIVKASTIDGIYDSDPAKTKGAKKYKLLSYNTALRDNLKIFDSAAFGICQENNIPIIVTHMEDLERLSEAYNREDIGTYVGDVSDEYYPLTFKQ